MDPSLEAILRTVDGYFCSLKQQFMDSNTWMDYLNSSDCTLGVVAE